MQQGNVRMQAVLVEDLVLLQNVFYVLLEVLYDLDSEVRAGAGLHCPEIPRMMPQC